LDVFIGRQKKSNDSRINLSALLHVSKTETKPKIGAKIVPVGFFSYTSVVPNKSLDIPIKVSYSCAEVGGK